MTSITYLLGEKKDKIILDIDQWLITNNVLINIEYTVQFLVRQ